MAYCRWSSMNWKCDLYIYEVDHGQYMIHVGARRIASDTPYDTDALWVKVIRESQERGEASTELVNEYMHAHQENLRWLGTAERIELDMPYAGETIIADIEGIPHRLRELKELGYLFPDYVLPSILEDYAAEEKARLEVETQ